MLKPSHFRPPYTKQIISDAETEIKSSSILRTKVQSISTIQPKTKSISMLTLNPSDLRPVSKNRDIFDHHHPHEKQVNRSSHSKRVNFGPNTVNFDPPHKDQITFDPSTKAKSNSIPPVKIMLISTPLLKSINPISILKSSHFRCLHTKTKWISIYTLKPSLFGPHTKSKSISIPRLKSSPVRSPT